jgi:SAM-dependent methyltransferase
MMARPLTVGGAELLKRTLCFTGILLLGGAGICQARARDIQFVATPMKAVDAMLSLAAVNSNDIVYDLGCGDGRFVIKAAVDYGARGVGIDIDPLRIMECNSNAVKAGVTNRVRFFEQDLFESDFRDATVVCLYLLPKLNLRLRPRLLAELRPGTRILSHEFDMADWIPDATEVVSNVPMYTRPPLPRIRDTVFYYWVVPAEAAGTWQWTIQTPAGDRRYAVHFAQKFQRVSGIVETGGRAVPVLDARLNGADLSFSFEEEVGGQNVVVSVKGRIDGAAAAGSMKIRTGQDETVCDWNAARSPLRLLQQQTGKSNENR